MIEKMISYEEKLEELGLFSLEKSWGGNLSMHINT